MPRTQLRFARVTTVVAIVLAIAMAAPSHAEADSAVKTLRARILHGLRNSTASALAFGVKVDGMPGIGLNGSQSLRPASTLKLYTGLVALLVLGPETRLTTKVRGTGSLNAGVLGGDVELVGGGDPLFSPRSLQSLAREIANTGIRRIGGRLYANDFRYDRARSAPGWRASYIPEDVGPLSALAVAGNRWRRDATYIRNPALGNVGLFRRYLADAGVTVAGPSMLGRARGVVSIEASRDSAQIRDIVRYVEKQSYNFGAELLLKELGRTIGSGTTANGVTVVKRWAAKFGTTTGTMRDGSGLSLYDRIRPWDEVDWLRSAMGSTVASLFKASLPIGCRSEGTLDTRFCGTAGSGRVYAKTGNLARTIALAGYTTTRSDRKVRFSFILPNCSNRDACRDAIDRAVVAIAGFTG